MIEFIEGAFTVESDSIEHPFIDLLDKIRQPAIASGRVGGGISAQHEGKGHAGWVASHLPAANLQMATTTAQRLLEGIRQLEWPASMPEDYQLTISIGVSVFGPDYDFGRQLRLADQALYRAKQNGRNRVESSFMR